MKNLAIITKTIEVKEQNKRGFAGEYSKEKGRTTVVRFFGIPVFKLSITVV